MADAKDTKDAKTDEVEARPAAAKAADEPTPRTRSRRPQEPAHEDTHQHAGYTGDEDLQARIDAAAGQE